MCKENPETFYRPLFSPGTEQWNEKYRQTVKQCKPDMTCNTGGYEGKRVAGKVKYMVSCHPVVLFITMNTLLPRGLVNALFSLPPHAPRPLTRD
jgi:hypothetical protein